MNDVSTETIPSSLAPPPHQRIIGFFLGRQKLHLRLWRDRILMIDGSNDDYDGAEAVKCCRRNISFEMVSLLTQLSKSLDPIIFGQVCSFSFVCSPEQPILPLLRASWQQKQLRSLPWQSGSGQAALSGQEFPQLNNNIFVQEWYRFLLH